MSRMSLEASLVGMGMMEANWESGEQHVQWTASHCSPVNGSLRHLDLYTHGNQFKKSLGICPDFPIAIDDSSDVSSAGPIEEDNVIASCI
jgi:hypothetical protein